MWSVIARDARSSVAVHRGWKVTARVSGWFPHDWAEFARVCEEMWRTAVTAVGAAGRVMCRVARLVVRARRAFR